MSQSQVLVIMGSESDFDSMKPCIGILDEFKISNEVVVASAHRTPHEVEKIAREAADNGVQVIIAAAGMAAHLAGVIAAHTVLPVIGVPMDGGALNGVDALYATVQMPGGIPVATMGIGKHGGKNAAYHTIQILALGDASIRERIVAYRAGLTGQVAAMNSRVQERLGRSNG